MATIIDFKTKRKINKSIGNETLVKIIDKTLFTPDIIKIETLEYLTSLKFDKSWFLNGKNLKYGEYLIEKDSRGNSYICLTYLGLVKVIEIFNLYSVFANINVKGYPTGDIVKIKEECKKALANCKLAKATI